jgi:CRP/FNR family transcriptional regulator, anaerobic regulatory protein
LRQLLDRLNELATLDEDVKNKLENLLKVEQFEKDDFILREGRTTKKLYFVESGLLRGFHYKEGKEVINWFCNEGQFATSMYSFVSQKPSYENIQAIEATKLFSIAYQDLQKLYQTYPAFDKIGRLLTEQYYVALEERIISLHFQTAKERYKSLLQNEEYLLQRVSLGFLASYLGITQETLSRIRKKTQAISIF